MTSEAEIEPTVKINKNEEMNQKSVTETARRRQEG